MYISPLASACWSEGGGAGSTQGPAQPDYIYIYIYTHTYVCMYY